MRFILATFVLGAAAGISLAVTTDSQRTRTTSGDAGAASQNPSSPSIDNIKAAYARVRKEIDVAVANGHNEHRADFDFGAIRHQNRRSASAIDKSGQRAWKKSFDVDAKVEATFAPMVKELIDELRRTQEPDRRRILVRTVGNV